MSTYVVCHRDSTTDDLEKAPADEVADAQTVEVPQVLDIDKETG